MQARSTAEALLQTPFITAYNDFDGSAVVMGWLRDRTVMAEAPLNVDRSRSGEEEQQQGKEKGDARCSAGVEEEERGGGSAVEVLRRERQEGRGAGMDGWMEGGRVGGRRREGGS